MPDHKFFHSPHSTSRPSRLEHWVFAHLVSGQIHTVRHQVYKSSPTQSHSCTCAFVQMSTQCHHIVTKCASKHDCVSHLQIRWHCMTRVMMPVHLAMTFLDVVPGTSENRMALHDYCHAANVSGTDIIPDVILQCSASQFVQQHAAHLRIRWPCMTSVMLPVYLALTSFLMSYCNVHHRNLCNSTRLI